MRFAAICIALCMCLTVVSLAQQLRPPPPVPLPEAPVGFDNQSNGMVDDVTHQADLAAFDSVETALQRAVVPRMPSGSGIRRCEPGD